ncbi:MAG TPA: GYD domain-containing protein [Burkholderiaceae bacterium]|jgi:uncharacterized protein with GYD domain|nr:GYD domain-containing protein [Burkholderiaceae bacterium]
MATYFVLSTFTEQGIRAGKQTTQRATAAQELAHKFGCNMREIFWTQGRYDVVTLVEAPDDAAITAFSMALGGLGNVRTETLRAFTQKEMADIVSKL